MPMYLVRPRRPGRVREAVPAPEADLGHFRGQHLRALLQRPQLRFVALDLDAALGDAIAAQAGHALWNELEGG
jgi:hypothetical protein